MHWSLLLCNIQLQWYGVCINGYVLNPEAQRTLTCSGNSSLLRGYKVMNFLASRQASINPSAAHIILETSSMSRTTMARVLGKKKNPIIQIHRLVFKHGKNKSAKSNIWCVQTFLKTELKRVTIKNVNQSWQGP